MLDMSDVKAERIVMCSQACSVAVLHPCTLVKLPHNTGTFSCNMQRAQWYSPGYHSYAPELCSSDGDPGSYGQGLP